MTDIARNAAPVTDGLLGRVRRLNARLEAAERLADTVEAVGQNDGLPGVIWDALGDFRRAGEEGYGKHGSPGSPENMSGISANDSPEKLVNDPGQPRELALPAAVTDAAVAAMEWTCNCDRDDLDLRLAVRRAATVLVAHGRERASAEEEQ